MPQERITALKMEDTAVEMTDVTETASAIVQKTEAPTSTYPDLSSNDNREKVSFF